MVSPDILLAAVPVGAVLMISGWSGCRSSDVRKKCSAHSVKLLMNIDLPDPVPPCTIRSGGFGEGLSCLRDLRKSLHYDITLFRTYLWSQFNCWVNEAIDSLSDISRLLYTVFCRLIGCISSTSEMLSGFQA